MAEPQPDHCPVLQGFLQDFRAKPEHIWRKGCVGPDNDIDQPYVSPKTLDKRLDDHVVEQLLDEIFPNTSKPETAYVRKHHLQCFAILLCIGHGHMIRHFTEHPGLQDRCLPFRSEPHDFPKSTQPNLFAAFSEQQWGFCPVKLEFDISHHLGEHDILPILSKKKLDEGGSAIVYKVEIDGEFDDLCPQVPENNGSNNHTYVFKTYRSREALKYFDKERDAFKKLRWNGKPPPNIVEFYGSFIRENTYNIILEYADLGNLDQYMEKYGPPTNPTDRAMFWDRFLEVLFGLIRIHHEDESGDNGPQIMLGWHQDIHPANILVRKRPGCSYYDCDFKISDLGLSHFKKYAGLSTRDATDGDTFGTNTYGAPETHRLDGNIEKTRLKVKPDVDIWSLGCVMSEVCVWFNDGWNKLVEYRSRRSEEMLQKTGTRQDCFHVDSALLETVNDIHEATIDSVRRSDRVTPKVIELIGDMLQVDHARPNIKYLYDKSRRIIQHHGSSNHQGTGALIIPDRSVRSFRNGQQSRKLPPSLPPHLHQNHSDPFSQHQTSRPTTHPGFQTNLPFVGGTAEMPDPFQASGTSPHGDFADVNPFPPFGQSYHPVAHPHVNASHGGPSTTNFSRHSELHQQVGEVSTWGQSLPEKLSQSGQRSPHTDRLSTYMDEDRRELYPPRRRQTRNFPLNNDHPSLSDAEEGNPLGISIAVDRSTNWRSNGLEAADVLERGATSELQSAPVPKHSPAWKHHPELSVKEALEIKRLKEKGISRAFPHEELLSTLKARDHAFLVDNAESMAQYRPEVNEVLELLSYMVLPFDPDGLDLYITTYPKKLKPRTNFNMLRELDKRPAKGMPDFRERFAAITSAYQNRFGKKDRIGRAFHRSTTPEVGPRRLSLYVLTDAVWQPNTTLITEVKTLVEELKKHNLTNKQIGIQFIRFGHDGTGGRRLAKLDSGLSLGLDIIDTTSWDGNVWKMLLGAINDWFDDDRDEDLADSSRAPNRPSHGSAAASPPGKGKSPR